MPENLARYWHNLTKQDKDSLCKHIHAETGTMHTHATLIFVSIEEARHVIMEWFNYHNHTRGLYNKNSAAHLEHLLTKLSSPNGN